MELTNEIVDLAYRYAAAFMRRKSRPDVDPNDLAHDTLVRLANAKDVDDHFIKRKVWLEITCTYIHFYTNATTRKHNIMLNAVHAEFDMKTTDTNTTDAIDEFNKAFEIVYSGNQTLAEIIKMMLNGMTVPEIAKIRGTTESAVYNLHRRARQAFAVALGLVAEVAA